jgi:hypothetical protein
MGINRGCVCSIWGSFHGPFEKMWMKLRLEDKHDGAEHSTGRVNPIYSAPRIVLCTSCCNAYLKWNILLEKSKRLLWFLLWDI